MIFLRISRRVRRMNRSGWTRSRGSEFWWTGLGGGMGGMSTWGSGSGGSGGGFTFGGGSSGGGGASGGW